MKRQNISKQSTWHGRSRTRNQRKHDRARTACMVAAVGLMWVGIGSMMVKAWVEEEPVNGQEYLTSIQVDSVNYESSKPVTVSQVRHIPEELEHAEAIEFFAVPIDHDIQAFVIRSCEDLNIDPAVIIAMIDQESDFREDCVGDNGDAVGLMQIQQKWHQERMDKLGVTDLMNPLQNVAVGIDYLAELIDKGNGLEWAVAAFNAGATGANNGIGFGYASAVLANSESLTKGLNYYA